MLSACSPGGKKEIENELAPAGGGIIYVLFIIYILHYLNVPFGGPVSSTALLA